MGISLADILNIVNAYSQIKRRQSLEVLPYNFVALQSYENIIVYMKIHIRQYGSPSIGHQP